MSRFSYLCGINPSSTSASHVVSQRAGYVSGGALQRHMASAHAGFFDDKCAACLELSAKTIAANGDRVHKYEPDSTHGDRVCIECGMLPGGPYHTS